MDVQKPRNISTFQHLIKPGKTATTKFAAYYMAAASARGMTCCWWDNNIFKGDGERFGLLDRKNLTWPDKILLDTLMAYAGFDKIPPREE